MAETLCFQIGRDEAFMPVAGGTIVETEADTVPEGF
jgi:hypothetical protein